MVHHFNFLSMPQALNRNKGWWGTTKWKATAQHNILQGDMLSNEALLSLKYHNM